MLYAIVCHDVKNSLPLRQGARPEHLARLQTLQDEGRLVLAGPLPAIDSDSPGDAGFTGSLIVAEFFSLQDAQAWTEQDPYTLAGVFESTQVSPFKQVFPT